MLCDPLQSRKVLQHALENRYAILAINADSHAAISDCLEAALSVDTPVIIETSLWQLKGHSFGGGDAVLGVARYLVNLAVLANAPRFRNIPVLYHTDHIKGPETMTILSAAIKGIPFEVQGQSLNLRASTVSLDASSFTHDETIEHICLLCALAEQAGVSVTLEMEDAVDEGITSEQVATKLLHGVEERYPGQIYLWAPGVGTQHGFGENMNFSYKTIEKQISLTRKITGREIGIALHGSTGLKSTDLSEASKAGVIKVNWSTESLLIRSTAARSYYQQMEKQFDKKHPAWKDTVMDNGVNSFVAREYIPKVVERMKLLGGEGKAAPLSQALN
jgi:fructose-bisphosphate aldolase, class II